MAANSETASQEVDQNLVEAVKAGNIEEVRELLERGADVHFQVEGGWMPLHLAAQAEKEDIVHLLLEKGAEPCARKNNGATPFIVAAIKGNVSLLKYFLSKGSDINEQDNNGFTALMEAASYGRKEALEFLYRQGADVNLRRETSEEKTKLGQGGATALMDAAERGHLHIVKILLDQMGADVNVRDNMHRNALIRTFRKPTVENAESIAGFLLDHHIDVNVRDESGKTPLILAVEQKQLSLVQKLLERNGTDVNDTDKEGKTALLVAVEKQFKDIVCLLCEKGAKTDCGNLIAIANRLYDTDLADLLRRYGARENVHCPTTDWRPNSKKWGEQLKHLNRIYRPMIGKLKIFTEKEYKIADTSEGGVYLGFFDGLETAVKIFRDDSERAEKEIDCILECRENRHLVKLYGTEINNNCRYVCLSLCERNLEEHLKNHRDADVESTKGILKSLFKAVHELHQFGFVHQDLHPKNILIDSKDEVCLADFDKSCRFANDQTLVHGDLRALGRLVQYVVTKGEDPFVEKGAAREPQELAGLAEIPDHMETLDLIQTLLSPGVTSQTQLSDILYHPFFWPCNMRYRFLRDVGNESDIKTRNTENKTLEKLNRNPSKSYSKWTSKIDKYVMTEMNHFYKKKKNPYQDTVTDLLKFIRNIGEHIDEKVNAQMKETIGDPAQYFQKTFPELVMHVYKNIQNTEFMKHIPNAQNSLLDN
ncbi:2-5A-dependent ribonuclease [Tachyglossus aculeatus]|uniref:2-5A-dependent ribonuclease n=1 Tax=Tachyglossus aculeatus TaxID=9261 RepID=UPI0018F2D1AB|nr:2-5A-dependent ribonuclease [Tachyglossus aculeatus]